MAARAQLTGRQRRFLIDQGYLVARSRLDQAVLARIAGRLHELVRQKVAAWADEPGLDTDEGCVVASFDVADPDFAPCHQHPLLAGAATAVLGDPWHVGGIDLRAPIPGCGEQGLHSDYGDGRTDGPWRTLSAMWCVTPFTRDSPARSTTLRRHAWRSPCTSTRGASRLDDAEAGLAGGGHGGRRQAGF